MKLFYKVFFESKDNNHNSKQELCAFVDKYNLEVISINFLGNGMWCLFYKAKSIIYG